MTKRTLRPNVCRTMQATIPRCPCNREMTLNERTARWNCGICGHIEAADDIATKHPDGADLCNCGFCLQRRPNHCIHVPYTKCTHCPTTYVLIDRESRVYEGGIRTPLGQTCPTCGTVYTAGEFSKGFVTSAERDKGWTLQRPRKEP